MSDDYYCQSAFTVSSSFPETVVSSRARLLFITVRNSAGVTGSSYKSLVLRDGSAGDIKYEVIVPANATTGINRSQYTRKIDMGGDGILFPNGIYVETGSSGVGSGSSCCIDAVTLFYL